MEGIYDFIEKHRRRSRCDLYWFEDSGSSGMDNSPRSGYLSERLEGSDVCHVDLACQQALSALHLAKICAVLGLQDKVSFYEAEQVRICQPINERYWSERAGWYFDFFQRDGKQAKIKYINAKTAAAFWTLLCGAATNGRKEAVRGGILHQGSVCYAVEGRSEL